MNTKTIFTILAIVAAVGMAITTMPAIPQQAHAAACSEHISGSGDTGHCSSANSFDNANNFNLNLHFKP